MSQLPSGFVLDEPPSDAKLPEGYVLDDPAPRSSALPEGYTLDQPAGEKEPAYYPSRKPSAVKRKEPEASAAEPTPPAADPEYFPSRKPTAVKREAPLYEIKPGATPETAELIIDPARYNEGIEAAKRDGLLDDSQVERINQVQAFVDERKALEAQAGDNPELKSYLQGLGRGSAMTLGAIASAKVAGAGGTAVGGPYVGIPAAIIAGIGGGIAAGKAYDKLYGELGKRFETYNEMLAASQVRPGYNAAGQLTSVAFALPVSATRAVQGLTTAYQAGGAQAVLRTAGTAAGLGAGTGVAGYTINQAVSGAPLEAEEVIKAAGLGVAMGGFFIGNRQVTMQEALAVANKARNGQPLSTGEQQILTRSAQAVRNIAQGVDDAANQDVLATPRLTDLTMRQSSIMGLMPQTTPAMATVRQMAPVQPGAAAAAQPPGQPSPAATALPAGAAAVGRPAPPPPGTTTPVPLSVVQNLPVPQPGATQATSGQAATAAEQARTPIEQAQATVDAAGPDMSAKQADLDAWKAATPGAEATPVYKTKWEARAAEIRSETQDLTGKKLREVLKTRAEVAGVNVPKGMKTDALIEAIAKSETRSRTIATPNIGDGVAPITQLIVENGGLMGKGRNYRGGEYDDAPSLREMGGFGRVLYSKEAMLRPDVAAQMAYDAGLIESPTAPALWTALRSEMQTYRSGRTAQEQSVENEIKTDDEWREYVEIESKRVIEAIKFNPRKTPTQAQDLEPGALARKDGEWYRVKQESDGTTKLVDGKTIELQPDEAVQVDGVIPRNEIGFTKALGEYNAQEAANARGKYDNVQEEQLQKQQAKEQIRLDKQQAEEDARIEREAIQAADNTRTDALDFNFGAMAEPELSTSGQSPAIKATDPRTGQTEFLGQDEGGFKLVGQDDPSVAARQAQADAEALAQAQAELDARQGRLFGVDPASDIKGAADEQSKGGYIQTPSSSSRAVRAIGTKIRQLLLPHRGVGNQVYDWWVWSEAQKDAAMVAGRADYERIEGILSEVKQRVPRAQAQQVIREFQDGIKTLPDVEAALGLPPNGPVSQVLKAVESSNRARQQLLAGWPGLSENLRQHILDNVYYQTRAYLKHALGPDFVPQASAIQDATTAIKNDLIDQLDKFDKRATSVRGKRGQVDVVNWLYTGDPQYLAGVSPTRRAAAEGLREQYLNLQHLVTGLQQNNNIVTAVRNVNAMGRAAEDVVEFYLSREAPGKGGAQGGIKIANLQHRMLDIAFRKLYGEILDPAMRQRITSEVQGKMLAQMTFFNRVIQEAEGIVWARYADRERGFMYRLGDVQSPSDIKRYGDLNGMYVNKEFYDLINSQKVHDDNVRKVIDALWFVPMSVQRGAKLINPRTIFRNYYTAVLGFAQGSGDAYLPGYWTAFWKAHGLAIRYARGDVKALEEIQSLYSMNVARVGQNSAVYDLQTSLTGMTGKIGKMGRNVMTAYTFIDFPSKYAAFEARRQYFEQRGMSPDEAAEAAARHVQDLYQNQDRIPEVIRKVTKTGAADYFGYFYDSVRIMGNQFKWAARSMTEYKDPRPMIGLFASRALLLAAGYFTNKFFTDVFSKMHESLRIFWDKQEDRDQKPISDDRTDAMREFMRDFDKNMPLMAWEERGADGKEYVYVTMLSGQSAFPLEDALLGAMTSSATGTEFFKGLGNNLWQSVDPGMYINTWSRLLAGQDLNKQRTPTGMGLYQILVNKEDPDRSAAMQDLFFELGKDFAPLGVGPALERINQIKERERAGQNNETWFQRTTTVDDAKASALRLIRTSRIEQSDMNWMVRETARPYVEAIKKNKSKINLPIKEQVTKGGATETQLAEAEKARSSLIQNRGELVKIARAAHKVNAKWYDQTNLFLTLTGAGIDGPMADSIVREAIYGTPSSEYEYVPNPSFRPTDVLQPDKEMGIYENRQRMRINEP